MFAESQEEPVNILLLVTYLVFAALGLVLLKLGGQPGVNTLFSVPIVNLPVSWTMLWGFICYGCSFLLYTVLINRFQLGYLVPLTTGIMYVFVLVSSVLLFKEVITPARGLGVMLILAGIFFMNAGK